MPITPASAAKQRAKDETKRPPALQRDQRGDQQDDADQSEQCRHQLERRRQ
jgi:hypothetical protein